MQGKSGKADREYILIFCLEFSFLLLPRAFRLVNSSSADILVQYDCSKRQTL